MTRTLTLITLALAAFIPTVALADRSPTAEEQAMIEQTLKGAGFQTWQSVKLDDGKWEVDNATSADGKVYDLELADATFEIIDRELDD